MPELPEVETVARQAAPLVRGQRLRRLEIFDPKLVMDGVRALSGRVIEDVFRLGKQVVIALAPKKGGKRAIWLCVHLRMTGRLSWQPKKGRSPGEQKHLRAALILERGSLLFIDVRRFGTLRICRSLDEIRPAGAEPLAPEFTAHRLAELLAGSPQELKPWLLRQDRIVGLGNIYVAEVLFMTGIHPRRMAGSLSQKEIKALHRALRQLLRKAIKYCGTTFSDFQTTQGQSGEFRRFLKVYGRAGEPCAKCGEEIERFTQQGRGTFFCPACQNGRA